MRGWNLLIGAAQQPPQELPNALREMRALFDRALRLDPNAADALSGSAITYNLERFFGLDDPGTDYESKALGQADRAIALDRNNVRAYFAKAQYLSLSQRFNDALGAADAGLASIQITSCSIWRARPPKIPSAASDRQRPMRDGPCG
jgi:hypothetical protein